MFTNLLFKYALIISYWVLIPIFSSDFATANPIDKPKSIIILGDSISAGYGIDLKQGWVNLLQKKLSKDNAHFQVINASVSGDTTAGGLARLPFLLKQHKPQIVIIELGGNDGLRGLPISLIRQNFTDMITLCKQSNTKVLLLGMLIPPNYGQKYTQAFENVFQELAKQHAIPLLPFMLKDIATVNDLMQADGIHPTQAAQTILLKNVWDVLEPLL